MGERAGAHGLAGKPWGRIQLGQSGVPVGGRITLIKRIFKK